MYPEFTPSALQSKFPALPAATNIHKCSVEACSSGDLPRWLPHLFAGASCTGPRWCSRGCRAEGDSDGVRGSWFVELWVSQDGACVLI